MMSFWYWRTDKIESFYKLDCITLKTHTHVKEPPFSWSMKNVRLSFKMHVSELHDYAIARLLTDYHFLPPLS